MTVKRTKRRSPNSKYSKHEKRIKTTKIDTMLSELESSVRKGKSLFMERMKDVSRYHYCSYTEPKRSSRVRMRDIERQHAFSLKFFEYR